jgi:hypothetical protein
LEGDGRGGSRLRGLAQAPVLFTGAGILATPTSANWMAILAVMGGCACAAVIVAVRGLSAVRESEPL